MDFFFSSQKPSYVLRYIIHYYIILITKFIEGTGNKLAASGLLAYVRDNDNFTVIRRKKFEPENIETICLEIKESNNSWFNISAVYRSPNKTKPAEFLQNLTLH